MTRIFVLVTLLLTLSACSSQQNRIVGGTKDVAIWVNEDGCPTLKGDNDPINIRRNGLIKWQLDNRSPGYRKADWLEVEFTGANPSDCESKSDRRKRKNKKIKCKIDNLPQPSDQRFCYNVKVTTDGKTYMLDPTIFVNGMQGMDRDREACAPSQCTLVE